MAFKTVVPEEHFPVVNSSVRKKKKILGSTVVCCREQPQHKCFRVTVRECDMIQAWPDRVFNLQPVFHLFACHSYVSSQYFYLFASLQPKVLLNVA